MKKHIYSTLAGAVVMLVVFFLFGFIDMHYFGAEIYNSDPFVDYSNRMGLFVAIIFGLKLFHAFLLSNLHEKIPRCGSGLWAKVWRFSLLSFFLVYGVGLAMTALTMTTPVLLVASWAVNGLLQTFAASFVIIPILYKYPSPDQSCKLNLG